MLLCWAFRNPDKVQAFAGIYPVCNLASWPLRRSKEAVEVDYGMTEEDILKNLDTFNPPENLDGLAKEDVPIFILHGGSGQINGARIILPIPFSVMQFDPV